MLQRFKAKGAGPYSEKERREIEYVTSLILSNSLAWKPFKPISELERDYVLYIRNSVFRACGVPFITAGLSFLLIDRVPGIRRLPAVVRWPIKIGSFLLFYAIGVDELKKRVFNFPLLDEVVAGGVVKYTKWMEIPSDVLIDEIVIKE